MNEMTVETQKTPDRPERIQIDRRAFPKVASGDSRTYCKQIQFWVRMLSLFSFAIMTYNLSSAPYLIGGIELTRQLFFAAISLFFGVTLFRYQKALGWYVESDTIANLSLTLDRQQTVWYLVTFSIILNVIVLLVFHT